MINRTPVYSRGKNRICPDSSELSQVYTAVVGMVFGRSLALPSSFLYSQTTTSAARRRRSVLSASCLLQAANPPHATLEVEAREFVVQNGVRNRLAEEVFGAFTAGLSSDYCLIVGSTYFSNAVNLWRGGPGRRGFSIMGMYNQFS